jgi:hypothetical protein
MLPNHRRGSAQRLGAGEAVNNRGLEGPQYGTPSMPGQSGPVKLLAVRPHPKPGYWRIELEGHPEFTILDAKLRNARRFRNVLAHRLNIVGEIESQETWLARVEAAIAAGGAV